MAASFVQSFVAYTESGDVATSLTVDLGTGGSGGVAPTPGNLLLIVAFIGTNGTQDASPATLPSGVSAASSTLYPSFVTTATYICTVPDSVPSSLEFSNFGGSSLECSAAIYVLEFSDASGVDVVTTDSTGTTVSQSGAGTASRSGDLMVYALAVNDGTYSASSISGTTEVDNFTAHGDGLNSYGFTDALFVATSTLSGTTIASESTTWSPGSSTDFCSGMGIALYSSTTYNVLSTVQSTSVAVVPKNIMLENIIAKTTSVINAVYGKLTNVTALVVSATQCIVGVDLLDIATTFFSRFGQIFNKRGR